MRISDWSSDVCSSDLLRPLVRLAEVVVARRVAATPVEGEQRQRDVVARRDVGGRSVVRLAVIGEVHRADVSVQEQRRVDEPRVLVVGVRSEEHTSELQSLMRISYAVFCLKKKKQTTIPTPHLT